MGWGKITTVALALVLAAACSGGDESVGRPTDRVDAQAERAEQVKAITGTKTVTETFVDTSRPTSASSAAPAADTRTLKTLITYPTPLKGAYPLVVLAHGMWGSPARFSFLAEAWAKAGYMVVRPAFPRTTDEQPGGAEAADFRDVVEQPADVSFVIDSVLDLTAAASEGNSPLQGHVDADHIGLAGHSLGGSTTIGTVFSPCCTDDRIDAIQLFAVPAPGDRLGGEFEPRPLPTLMIVADGDFIYKDSEALYPMLEAPKWYLTLHGEQSAVRHPAPFEDLEDPADDLVRDVTTHFWDMTLADDKAAQARMEKAAQPADGSTTLQTKTN